MGKIVESNASWKGGINAIAVTSVLYNGKDVTNKIDNTALINTMSSCKCKRMFNSLLHYQSSEVNWTIDITFHQKPI
jgi:hypothetical protein